jgi:hypothetical protein
MKIEIYEVTAATRTVEPPPGAPSRVGRVASISPAAVVASSGWLAAMIILLFAPFHTLYAIRLGTARQFGQLFSDDGSVELGRSDGWGLLYAGPGGETSGHDPRWGVLLYAIAAMILALLLLSLWPRPAGRGRRWLVRTLTVGAPIGLAATIVAGALYLQALKSEVSSSQGGDTGSTSGNGPLIWRLAIGWGGWLPILALGLCCVGSALYWLFERSDAAPRAWTPPPPVAATPAAAPAPPVNAWPPSPAGFWTDPNPPEELDR